MNWPKSSFWNLPLTIKASKSQKWPENWVKIKCQNWRKHRKWKLFNYMSGPKKKVFDPYPNPKNSPLVALSWYPCCWGPPPSYLYNRIQVYMIWYDRNNQVKGGVTMGKKKIMWTTIGKKKMMWTTFRYVGVPIEINMLVKYIQVFQ